MARHGGSFSSSWIASIFLIGSLTVFYAIYGLRYGLGTLHNPGPGAFPRGIAIVLITGVFWLILSSVKSGKAREVGADEVSNDERSFIDLVKGASVPIAVLLFVVVVVKVGFLIPAVGLSIFIMSIIGGIKIWKVCILSVAIAFVISILVGGMLGVPLPANLVL